MLPLLSTSLLDTLKILMIGNALTFSNHMPSTFEDLMLAEERMVNIDSVFIRGEGVECNILKYLYPDQDECSAAFIKSHKVWKKENAEHSEFVNLVKGYDVVYLQSNSIDNPVLYEIISSIDQIIDNDGIIVLFQNYSKNRHNETARKKELDRQDDYFDQHNKSEKVILMPVGDYFDMLTGKDPTSVVDKNGNPTPKGSEIIAQALFEIVRPYIY